MLYIKFILLSTKIYDQETHHEHLIIDNFCKLLYATEAIKKWVNSIQISLYTYLYTSIQIRVQLITYCLHVHKNVYWILYKEICFSNDL